VKRSFGLLACLLLVLVLSGCGPSVPDVAGMTRAAAQVAMAEAGFVIGDVSYDESSVDPTGTVVAQEPAAGTRAEKDSRISLTLAGARPVPAPILVGLDSESVFDALEAAGLSAGSVTETYSATVPAGQIISQNPAAGAEIPKGTSVEVVISKGPRIVTVPDVYDMTQAKATAMLKALGFAVSVTVKPAESASGNVVAQDPRAGSKQAGGTVRITVSEGMAPSEARLIGTWKGSNGSTLHVVSRNRIGVVRYRLSGTLLVMSRAGADYAGDIVWISADKFTLTERIGDKHGPTITYDRVK